MKPIAKRVLTSVLKDEEGVAAAEYAILLGLLAVALLTAIVNFSNAIQNVFNSASNSLNS